MTTKGLRKKGNTKEQYNQYQREYRAANKEKIREYRRKWMKEWREKNIEEDSAYRKKYYEENKERIKMKTKERIERKKRERRFSGFVYRIRHKKTGRAYIGISNRDPFERWYQHVCYGNRLFYKDGEDETAWKAQDWGTKVARTKGYTFEIIVFQEDTGSWKKNREQLEQKETEQIAKHGSKVCNIKKVQNKGQAEISTGGG